MINLDLLNQTKRYGCFSWDLFIAIDGARESQIRL